MKPTYHALAGLLTGVTLLAVAPVRDSVGQARRRPAASSDVDWREIDVNSLDGREQIRYTSEAVSFIDNAVSDLQQSVDEATSLGDLLLLSCLDPKLFNVQRLQGVVGDAAVSLESHVSDENRDLAVHEFRRVVVSRQQAEEIVREAGGCVGEVAPTDGSIVITYLGEQPDSNYVIELYVPPEGYVRPPRVTPYQ